MSRDAARHEAFRGLAAGLTGVDVDVYREAGRDPLDPILGAGDPACRVAIFGRDPGRHEVIHGQPFVGAGGQKVRAALHRALGRPLPMDFVASLDASRHAFWANTVPYKPLGNKVWPPAVRAAFAPWVRDLLVHGWQGHDVLALGNEAIQWFAANKAERARIDAFLARPDRYEASFEVVVAAPDGASRTLTIHPVPHPSPLNATWAPHIARLLDQRLAALGWGPATWRLGGPSPGPV